MSFRAYMLHCADRKFYVGHTGADREVGLRIFGKPATRPFRRMGVALARAATMAEARALAAEAAGRVEITYS
jgi:formate-dependent phosphoribosylglycinamide formyltransferase (GAR transformylase)